MSLMNTLRSLLFLAATCQAGSLSVPSYTITRVITPGLALPWGINQAGEQHPCFWNEHTDLRDLETFGGTSGGVRDINNLPQVTSTAPPRSWTERAYLWSSGAGKVDLGTLGGQSYGLGINNDAGQVARESAASDGSAPAFVWLAAGLGGVIALRRRRSAGLLALAGLLGFVLAERSSPTPSLSPGLPKPLVDSRDWAWPQPSTLPDRWPSTPALIQAAKASLSAAAGGSPRLSNPAPCSGFLPAIP